MVELKKLVSYLDVELKVADVADYPAALNGLQLGNDGYVSKVGAAVDASLPVFEKAVSEGVDLLIVHHGMFWHGSQRIVAAQYEKLKLAINANMAVYSSHIPLDIHHEWGNNVILAKRIGMNNPERFHQWKGQFLGLKQELDVTFDDLLQKVRLAVGGEVVHCQGRKSSDVGMVGLITGGAGSEIQAMVDEGINTFITGEGPHWSYPLAEELGVNFIYGGHYATETFGVLRLMEVLAQKYSLSGCFLDHPSGL